MRLTRQRRGRLLPRLDGETARELGRCVYGPEPESAAITLADTEQAERADWARRQREWNRESWRRAG